MVCLISLCLVPLSHTFLEPATTGNGAATKWATGCSVVYIVALVVDCSPVLRSRDLPARMPPVLELGAGAPGSSVILNEMSYHFKFASAQVRPVHGCRIYLGRQGQLVTRPG
ncbi:hypothetical protein BD779DRAFT_1481577 [Infundibulicybe gibba]|nr:hypothetical protein BD779DRAFT_1481577 [Infundibulicybe gibba]